MYGNRPNARSPLNSTYLWTFAPMSKKIIVSAYRGLVLKLVLMHLMLEIVKKMCGIPQILNDFVTSARDGCDNVCRNMKKNRFSTGFEPGTIRTATVISVHQLVKPGRFGFKWRRYGQWRHVLCGMLQEEKGWFFSSANYWRLTAGLRAPRTIGNTWWGVSLCGVKPHLVLLLNYFIGRR